ncbi:MAG: domain S-box protein [Marmoricola sp.]|nr:domain S-box protein [Marmoricola sp.]
MVLMTGFTPLAVDTSGEFFHVLFTSSSQTVSASVELALGSVSFLAAVVAARTALRGRGASRFAWSALATAMVCWATSNVFFDLTALAPGWGSVDVARELQLVAIGMIVLGMAVMPAGRWQHGAALRTCVDIVVMLVCLALVGTVVVVRYVLSHASSPADELFSLLYPSTALILCSQAYAKGRRAGAVPAPAWPLLVAAFGAWAFAGIGYAVTTPNGFIGAPVINAAFACGTALVICAAWAAGRPIGSTPALQLRSHQMLLALPELVVVAAAAAAMLGGLHTWYDWTTGSLAAVAVVVRQSIFSTDARRSRASLEAEVEDRTAQLHRANARHERILAAVEEGIVGVDADGCVSFVNVAAGRMLGYEPAALVGRDACGALCGSQHEECQLHLVGSLGHVITDEHTTFRRSDGSLLPVEFTAGPQETPNPLGRAGVVLAFRDITERQAVEQIKQQFVSSVSHELRTPLTSIRGVLEMLSDGDAGDLPETAHDLIATAKRGSERLSRLVNDIIDVEKLASGDFSVVPGPTDIPALIGDAIASLEGLAAAHGVQLRFGELGGWAWCDADRVEQALVNLIGNAIKFSAETGGVVVSAVAAEAHVVVTVQDNGRGIPEEHIATIFERFHQVNATDASEKGGTGLGLTITRSIVERHGGRIWVESTVGEGSAFSFTLPLAPVLPHDEPHHPSPVRGHSRVIAKA